eukprot:XP_011664745.1 PREDICTED: probable anion transporter 7 [Strongylocentrotus purpuratus]
MVSGLDDVSTVTTDILHMEYSGKEESEPLLKKIPRPANTAWSCRYIVSYMSFLALTCGYMNRVNLSVAITAMANSTYSSTYDVVNSSAEEGEFPWDSHTQELILAAFYYGLPLFQIPAGLVADKFPRSCPLIIGIAYFIAASTNLLIPLGAYNSGASAIIALRIIAGVAEVRRSDKSSLNPFPAYSRIRTSSAVGHPLFIFSLPKKYPWKHFLTSLPLYAVCATDFAILWIFYSLTANLPIFLKEALRFDTSQAGILSAVPHITFAIFIMIGGAVADFILRHTNLSVTTVRKFMTTLGLLPAGTFLVLAGYVGCNAILVITCISLGLASTGFAFSGASLTMMEFAPSCAGMVVAIANTAGTIPGFVAPIVVANYTENQADISGWRSFFWITFGISVAAWLIFMIFGTSELQPWAKGVKGGGDIDSKESK